MDPLSPGSPTFKALFSLSFIFSTISIIFSALIIRSVTYTLNRYPSSTRASYAATYSHISVAARFPLFLSIIDLGWHLVRALDVIIALSVNKSVASVSIPLCSVFGGLTTFFIVLQACYQIAIAFYMYRVIYREIEPNYGPFYYKLHVSCLIAPLVILIIGFSLNEFGQEREHWCGVKSELMHLYLVNIIVFLTFLILAIVYGMTGSKIYGSLVRHERQARKESHAAHMSVTQNLQHQKMKRTAWSLPFFVIAFAFVWLPLIFHSVIVFARGSHVNQFVNESELVIIFILAITTSSSGILNAIAFHRLVKNQKRRIEQSMLALKRVSNISNLSHFQKPFSPAIRGRVSNSQTPLSPMNIDDNNINRLPTITDGDESRISGTLNRTNDNTNERKSQFVISSDDPRTTQLSMSQSTQLETESSTTAPSSPMTVSSQTEHLASSRNRTSAANATRLLVEEDGTAGPMITPLKDDPTGYPPKRETVVSTKHHPSESHLSVGGKTSMSVSDRNVLGPVDSTRSQSRIVLSYMSSASMTPTTRSTDNSLSFGTDVTPTTPSDFGSRARRKSSAKQIVRASSQLRGLVGRKTWESMTAMGIPSQMDIIKSLPSATQIEFDVDLMCDENGEIHLFDDLDPEFEDLLPDFRSFSRSILSIGRSLSRVFVGSHYQTSATTVTASEIGDYDRRMQREMNAARNRDDTGASSTFSSTTAVTSKFHTVASTSEIVVDDEHD